MLVYKFKLKRIENLMKKISWNCDSNDWPHHWPHHGPHIKAKKTKQNKKNTNKNEKQKIWLKSGVHPHLCRTSCHMQTSSTETRAIQKSDALSQTKIANINQFLLTLQTLFNLKTSTKDNLKSQHKKFLKSLNHSKSQSDAIRRNQTQSNAIKRNQTQSNAIRPNQNKNDQYNLPRYHITCNATFKQKRKTFDRKPTIKLHFQYTTKSNPQNYFPTK